MKITSVQGIIDSSQLGTISPHEHVLIDIRNQYTEPKEAGKRLLGEQCVQLSNLDVLSRNPYALRDNLVLNDPQTAELELLEFKKAGGDSLVDATCADIGRDPITLYKISRSTGLHIIAGCGYYTFDTHPKEMSEKTVEQIREEILKDLTIGISDTSICAGVIGEIGTSSEIHPNERKVLEASADASVRTNTGIIVHTYPWSKNGLEIIDIMVKRGVPANKISINHVDVEINIDYCRSIAKKGAYFEFDDFGKEYFIDYSNRGFAGGIFARDIERVLALKQLIEERYAEHILISCDVCLKTLLHQFGGWGYDHILSHIIPMMRHEGINEDDINIILKENPKRFIEFN